MRDVSGREPWNSYVTTFRPDGSIAEQTIFNRDGSAIRSEFSASPSTTGWDERHTVVGASGNVATFQNFGPTQTIIGSYGLVLGAATWTARGPEPDAIVQPAFAPGGVLLAEAAIATVELALTLFAWLSSRDEPGKKPVIAFRAREYRGTREARALDLLYVGRLDYSQVEAACPGIVKIQELTNDAAAEAKANGPYASAAVYGTAVHTLPRDETRKKPENVGFRAEVSLMKTQAEAPRVEGSIRIDVLEKAEHQTACVYDIKTGRKVLKKGRSTEIAERVFRNFPDTMRIIVVEVRPTE